MTAGGVIDPPVVGPARARRPMWPMPQWLVVPLWVVVGAMAVVAVMRQFAWDDLEPFAVLNTVTAFIYLPAWLVAIVALIGRRLALLAASLLLVAFQIVLMWPELTAAQPVPAWASSAPSIGILDANVYNQNDSMAGYAATIEQVRPQLVTLEEATPVQDKMLERSGVLSDLPHRLEIRRFDSKGFLVASKYPLTSDNVVYYDYQPLILQTTVLLPSGPQALWVVHTTAPLPGGFSQWQGQLATIDRLLRARGPVGLLVAGDFNATWGNKGFRSLLDAGMTDGAAARGRAFDMTWSQNDHPLPPLVRIDHLLSGPGVAVTRIRTGPGPGSDHRDLVATVAIRPKGGGGG
jgi:endonuclease/exonuclease/phosphatase (EEP) superfamily protein YafD